MLRSARPSALLGAISLCASASAALAGGLTPQEARERMVVPPGFKVQVFASEPEIRQPVAACFDERGRMWVIEYLQYPNPAGLVPVKVDQYLRTQYDRVPEPPPKGPRGADRIKILEDIDGDGKADKVTTFLEGLNLASAIAVGHGGVFVGQAPYLLFYPDKDRDDKPDADPEVLLSGFGLEDAHATVNSLAWGPDGWLYGAQGSTVTAKIRGIEFQQGIWRYHPKTKKFELFAEGGGNTWGLDYDRGGNAFGSSNGSFIAFHMKPGANYWKGFAKHGPLHNPRSYGYFDSIAFSGTKPGGHVTPGGIIYKGEQFPEEYRGAFIGANLLSNSVYWYKLAPKGSTFTMTLGGTLLDSKDPWFRPIDLLTGPDGSVYVVDWYDKRASHLDPRDTWDRSNGRIYKISYGDPPKVKPFDLAKLSTEELVRLRNEPNDWWSETARRILYERRDIREVDDLLDYVRSDTQDEALALRDLFALNACGGLTTNILYDLRSHPLPGVRRWLVRLAAEQDSIPETTVNLLRRLAEQETDPTVLGQLLSSCQRLSPELSSSILQRLLRREPGADAGSGSQVRPLPTGGGLAADPHLPLQAWWAIERILRDKPKLAVGLFETGPHGKRSPLVARELLPRTVRALAETGSSETLGLCAELLDRAPTEQETEALLDAMARGLEGAKIEAPPASLSRALDAAADRGAGKSLPFLRVAARLGLPGASSRAVEALKVAKSDSDRLGLISLLGAVPGDEGKTALLETLGRETNGATLSAIIDALARYGDASVATAILARYSAYPQPVRTKALDALSQRPAWAAVLVQAIGEKSVPAKDLSIAQARRIASLGDSALSSQLEAAWGRIPGQGSEAKAKRIAEVRGVLPEWDKGKADRGAAVFRNVCAGCHRLFNEGERIGPDLTGAERGDLDFLLTSLVDPSGVIRKEYQPETLALKDGRVLTGLIVDEDGGTITLFDSQKQRTRIAKPDIEDRKAAETSIMPDGLLDNLSEEQVRDLFKYLQSSGPGR